MPAFNRPGLPFTRFTSGTTIADFGNAFSVGLAVAVQPSVVAAGTTLDVTLGGNTTHFDTTTQIYIGSGISINSLTVYNSLSG